MGPAVGGTFAVRFGAFGPDAVDASPCSLMVGTGGSMTITSAQRRVDIGAAERPTGSADGRVVVGVDGSSDSVAAPSWTIRRAARCGLLAEVVVGSRFTSPMEVT